MKKSDKDIDQYQKKGFFKRLPFGLKASFIKYWFYGAVYFFTFMGLGLYVKNENLLIVAGLIGGVLFDIALYNIYLLIAETREEASKWWFFKSKHFYSIFINAAIMIGVMFLFYAIVTPIKKAMGSSFFLQEPLTAGLLFLAIDTSLVWLKNLSIMLFKKIFIKKGKDGVLEDGDIRLVDVTPVSVTIEISNNSSFNTLKNYNVTLNNDILFKKLNNNVLTIYDLKPDTQYKLGIGRKNVTFTTGKISKFYKAYDGDNLQDIIDASDKYALIVVNKGTYHVKSLTFKDDIVIYFRKGVVIIPSSDINDYPIVPEYYPFNKDEPYGNFLGEVKEIRQAIFHLDHLFNVKIVGEAIIDYSELSKNFTEKITNNNIPPHVFFINHCKDIKIDGFTIKNSSYLDVNCFFSEKVELLNLKIEKEIPSDSLHICCCKHINVIGNQIKGAKTGISVKSAQPSLKSFIDKKTDDIFIDNCLLENCVVAISGGKECSNGLFNVRISNCKINNVDKGVFIFANVLEGPDATLKDFTFKNMTINKSNTPIAIDMNYESKPSTKSVGIPYFDNFVFENIVVNDYKLCAGIFYGLDKKYIGEVHFNNCKFNASNDAIEGYPLPYNKFYNCKKNGFVVNNVRTFHMKKVIFTNIEGDRVLKLNIGELSDEI